MAGTTLLGLALGACGDTEVVAPPVQPPVLPPIINPPPPPPPPPPTQAAVDRGALAAFFSATGGANWTNNDNWLTDAPLGDWYGVSVNDSGSVTHLRLGDNGLTGTMPPEIGDLASVEVLILGRSSHGFEVNESNALTGPIPPELGNLTKLRILTLADNSLSGPIPPELGNLVTLTTLWLFDNQLTGAIPSALGRLTALRGLLLDNNDLKGPIPHALGNLEALRSLSLVGNVLDGPVPHELGGLSNLDNLNLSSNLLNGHLPIELAQGLDRVETFLWDGNDGLCVPNADGFDAWLGRMRWWDGPRCGLPQERDALVVFYGATGGSEWKSSNNWLSDAPLTDWQGVTTRKDGGVTEINLPRNNLVGTIPVELGALTSLLELNLYGNELTGPVPIELDNTSLVSLYFARNRLVGEIPNDVLELPNLKFLGWRHNAGLCAPQTEQGLVRLAGIETWDGALCGEAEPGFQIQLVFAETVPAVLRDAMEAASEYWMQVLGATELRDFGGEGGPRWMCDRDYSSIRIDDVLISVWVEDTLSALATGGPCVMRGEPEMPLNGVVKFDPDRIDWLVANGALEGVARHEIGHVLGIGTMWESRQLLANKTTETADGDTHFLGALAIAAFDDAGGKDYKGDKVPVQQRRGGLGNNTAVEPDNSHWRGSVFGNEIMSPGWVLGRPRPVSRITLQSLADLGYLVDLSMAEEYTLPAAEADVDRSGTLHLGDDVLRFDPPDLELGLDGSALGLSSTVQTAEVRNRQR